ncbi:PilZ domain-containing protein [Lentibacter algarum]|jgi:hypothetical protein|uniref:PilZ domain-containing protein n=1 Tax=Lentibacter algarum TaxID=576131 RepID=UPI0023F527DA|nr:PilZ domain-containing protein [Lentibacter algarum]
MLRLTRLFSQSCLGLVFWATSLAAETCEIEQWLVDFQIATVNFVEEAYTPMADEMASRLQNVASEHSNDSLRRALRDSGHEEHEALILRVTEHQKLMLRSFNRYGPQKLFETRQVKKMRALLGPLQEVLQRLDCAEDPSWGPSGGVGSNFPIGPHRPVATSFALLGLIAFIAGALTLHTRYIQKCRRREQRYPCNRAVQLSAYNRTQAAQSLDISQNGMKLRSDWQCPLGTPCQVIIGNIFIAGKIRWSNAEYCGVNFDHPLDQTVLQQVLELGQTAPNAVPA